MRIMHVSSARTFGGGERHLVDLCRELHGRGHEVFVALRPTNEWQRRLDFLPAENIFHVSIRNSFGVLSSLKIAEFAKQNEVQIIHAHVARDYIPSSIACLAAKPAKFVLTRHVLFPLKPFNRFALSNLSAAIGVSDAVGAELKKVFPPSKVVVIKNGLAVRHLPADVRDNLRAEFRSFHGIPEQSPVVGLMGELKELKGQRDIILAASELVKTAPDLRYVMVGKDNSRDRSFRRELKRMAKTFSVADKIVWLDWLEDTEPFFAGIDLFVSPSHSESFGLAMLEAMANGVPVLATKTAGARELLGKDAELVPIEDPVALAAEIAALIEHPEKMQKLGSLYVGRAEELFPLKPMVDRTEAVYLRLVG